MKIYHDSQSPPRFEPCPITNASHTLYHTRSEVITAVRMSMSVSWVVTLCELAGGYQVPPASTPKMETVYSS
jgi:hypothetical protein